MKWGMYKSKEVLIVERVFGLAQQGCFAVVVVMQSFF